MSTRELVDALISGDSVAIDSAFDTVMTQKVSANLDGLKAHIATNMFNVQDETSAEEVE
jgi:hypothetical protein